MSDFGLSEDIYKTGYFRQNRKDSVRLPFKWIAPKSLRDAIFTEKSDVVCYQVCMVRDIYRGGEREGNLGFNFPLPPSPTHE